jgi:hypothetical protein
MKYREKLLEFIFNDDLEEDALYEWITSMPLLDQPDILREFQALVTELAAEEGKNIADDVPEMNNFSAFIENYEDKILDEKLAEANLVMALEDLDKSIREMDEATTLTMREYIFLCVEHKTENSESMLEFAEKVIAFEQTKGTYDPDNWYPILPLLNKRRNT